jgi:hypothetical protein
MARRHGFAPNDYLTRWVSSDQDRFSLSETQTELCLTNALNENFNQF